MPEESGKHFKKIVFISKACYKISIHQNKEGPVACKKANNTSFCAEVNALWGHDFTNVHKISERPPAIWLHCELQRHKVPNNETVSVMRRKNI